MKKTPKWLWVCYAVAMAANISGIIIGFVEKNPSATAWAFAATVWETSALLAIRVNDNFVDEVDQLEKENNDLYGQLSARNSKIRELEDELEKYKNETAA